MSFKYDFERPSVTVDIIVLNHRLEVLLLQRAENPGKGKWCLPGGHIDPNESPLQAATRELYEETGLVTDPLKLFDVRKTGDPSEGWRLKSIYYAKIIPNLIKKSIPVKLSVEHTQSNWKQINLINWDMPQLFSDHNNIIDDFYHLNIMK